MSKTAMIEDAKPPSVRDAVRKLNGFLAIVCAQEALARNGFGGVVRIEAMTPVLEAIDKYVAQLPPTQIER